MTTDIIVGFCGESEEDFQATRDLMERTRFDSAFMFKYSERPGTAAHRSLEDDVPEQVKGERLQKIIGLQESICLQKNEAFIGKTVEVLVEGPSKRRRGPDDGERLFGRCEHGKTVIIDGPAQPNSLRRVLIDEVTSHTLFGALQPT